MKANWSIYRAMGALLALDTVLLVVSGVPAFKNADSGWQYVVGAAAWMGFVITSATLVALAAGTLVARRRRKRVDRVAAPRVYEGGKAALLGAGALAAAMLADLAETVVDPTGSGGSAKVYEAAVEHHDVLVVSGFLLLASAAFLFPGVYLLARGVLGRGRRVAKVAVVLAFLGTMGHTALGTAYLAWAAIPGAAANDEQMVAALDRVTGSATMIPLVFGFLAFPLSIVALFAALLRAGIAPRWVLALVVAAPVADAVSPGPGYVGTAVALMLLLTCLAGVTVRIARGASGNEGRMARRGLRGAAVPARS